MYFFSYRRRLIYVNYGPEQSGESGINLSRSVQKRYLQLQEKCGLERGGCGRTELVQKSDLP